MPSLSRIRGSGLRAKIKCRPLVASDSLHNSENWLRPLSSSQAQTVIHTIHSAFGQPFPVSLNFSG